MFKVMQNFKTTCLRFHGGRSPCSHVMSHITRRKVITIWT